MQHLCVLATVMRVTRTCYIVIGLDLSLNAAPWASRMRPTCQVSARSRNIGYEYKATKGSNPLEGNHSWLCWPNYVLFWSLLRWLISPIPTSCHMDGIVMIQIVGITTVDNSIRQQVEGSLQPLWRAVWLTKCFQGNGSIHGNPNFSA